MLTCDEKQLVEFCKPNGIINTHFSFKIIPFGQYIFQVAGTFKKLLIEDHLLLNDMSVKEERGSWEIKWLDFVYPPPLLCLHFARRSNMTEYTNNS